MWTRSGPRTRGAARTTTTATSCTRRRRSRARWTNMCTRIIGRSGAPYARHQRKCSLAGVQIHARIPPAPSTLALWPARITRTQAAAPTRSACTHSPSTRQDTAMATRTGPCSTAPSTRTRASSTRTTNMTPRAPCVCCRSVARRTFSGAGPTAAPTATPRCTPGLSWRRNIRTARANLSAWTRSGPRTRGAARTTTTATSCTRRRRSGARWMTPCTCTTEKSGAPCA